MTLRWEPTPYNSGRRDFIADGDQVRFRIRPIAYKRKLGLYANGKLIETYKDLDTAKAAAEILEEHWLEVNQ